MKKTDGIEYSKKDNYSLFTIKHFSNDIECLLREHLSCICHGVSDGESGMELYNYKRTLNEFVKRYRDKPKKIQIGMIGELLAHIIIREYFPEFKVSSPFFNLEERSIKKGFDLLLSKSNDSTLWITEVKSGALHQDKDASGTINDLILAGKRDLVERLDDENASIWMNAIHGAKIVFEKYNDLKTAVVEILSEYAIDGQSARQKRSADYRVLLVGGLFASTDTVVVESGIQSQQQKIKSENVFMDVMLLTIHKNTYTKVYDFIVKECAL